MPKVEFNGKRVNLIALSSNIPLAEEISKLTKIPLTEIELKKFSDGETYVKIAESIRGSSVYLVQPTNTPVNHNYMELFIAVDALKRASAKEVSVIMPYYGYSRQDRKASSREPITAKLVADLLQAAGVDRVVCLDLHAAQIQGFYDIPIDNFTAVPLLAYEFSKKKIKDLVVVSPDHGGVTRAYNFAKHFPNVQIAIIDKRRPEANKAEVFHIVGDVEGKNAVIIDDMIDTAGTLVAASEALIKKGVKKVYAIATHPILSGPAIERIEKSPIEEVIVTNSILLNKKSKKIKVISVAEILADAILRLISDKSVSGMFQKYKKFNVK